MSDTDLRQVAVRTVLPRGGGGCLTMMADVLAMASCTDRDRSGAAVYTAGGCVGWLGGLVKGARVFFRNESL